MSGGVKLLSIDGARNADISTDNSLQVLLYDGSGNPLAVLDQSAIDRTKARGLLQAGADYKTSRLLRASPDGTLRAGTQPCLFYDSIEGANVDTNKWVATVSTFTITQAIGTGTLYNAASSTQVSAYALQATNRFFPFISRQGMVFRTKVRHTAWFVNTLIESGFGSPANGANAPANGATWLRRDSDGAYVPTVYVNTVGISGTPITQATFLAAVATTDYFYQEIFLEESRATFRLTTQAGLIINEQTIDFTAAVGTLTATHLQVFNRIYNTGTPATAGQLYVAQTSVWLTDAVGPEYQVLQSQNSYGSLTNPTTYAQNANYANSAAPTSATLSNTAAGYTALGGQWQFAAVAGAETDYALFAIQIPSPYTFICTGVRIAAVNTVAAVATTPTVLQWGLGFNSNAVSLATGAPSPYMRKAIGIHSWIVGAAIGQSGGPDVVWQGKEAVQPGKFLSVILKVPLGTATATEIFRGICDINGYFE